MTEQTIMTEATTKDWTDTDWKKFHDWLHGMLKTSQGTVTFTKKDGTERVMKCTLVPDQLPPVVVKEDAKPRKESETSIRVFDLELKEWRSFTTKSVKQINFVI